jgi:OOP family OmpA-OmpF porin
MSGSPKKSFFACVVAGALVAAGARAQPYVVSGGEPVRTGDGHCLRAGTWTAEAASAECDPALALNVSVTAGAAPKPVRYQTEVQFAFDDDVLSADARNKLDELAQKLAAMEIDKVVAVGYADDVGPADYNRRLSARRAKAVGDYLGGKGVSGERLQLVAMGAHDAVTAGSCDFTPERPSDAKRIACLQPDRRVKVELVGRRKAEPE